MDKIVAYSGSRVVVGHCPKMTGINKKVDIVNYALKKLVEQKEIEEILKLKGKIEWTEDLEEMRKGRDDTR